MSGDKPDKERVFEERRKRIEAVRRRLDAVHDEMEQMPAGTGRRIALSLLWDLRCMLNGETETTDEEYEVFLDRMSKGWLE